MKTIIAKIKKWLKNKKIEKILAFIIEHKDEINARIDDLIKRCKVRDNGKEVKMTLDYIPSWLTGAKTLLAKIDKCVEVIEEVRHGNERFLTAGSGISIDTNNRINVIDRQIPLYKHRLHILDTENHRVWINSISKYNISISNFTELYEYAGIDEGDVGTYVDELVSGMITQKSEDKIQLSVVLNDGTTVSIPITASTLNNVTDSVRVYEL